jgi:hypothetical protein
MSIFKSIKNGDIGFGYIGTDIVEPICPFINGDIGFGHTSTNLT